MMRNSTSRLRPLSAACRAVLQRGPSWLEHDTVRFLARFGSPTRFRKLQECRVRPSPLGHWLGPIESTQCIFIHIPKCAGNSIAHALFGFAGPGHLTAAEYQLIYPRGVYRRYFKFAFVRNPWDRLASAYHFLRQGGMNRLDRQFAERHLAGFTDFRSFVMNWVTPENIGSYIHFRPQVHSLRVGRRPLDVDFLGYYENLSADFLWIRARLGGVAELPHDNKTRGVEAGRYVDLYTPEMIEVVGRVYAADVREFGYDFANAGTAALVARRMTPRTGER